MITDPISDMLVTVRNGLKARLVKVATPAAKLKAEIARVMKAAGYIEDAFVTGEMKHHQYLWANAHGIAAFDAGHFSTENIVIEPLKDCLANAFPKAEFIISRQTCPYQSC